MPPASSAMAGLPSLSLAARPTSGSGGMPGGDAVGRLMNAYGADRAIIPDERNAFHPTSVSLPQQAGKDARHNGNVLSLGHTMAALDGRLRGQLEEQAQQNEAVLRAFKEGALIAASAAASAFNVHPAPGGLAASLSMSRHSGTLPSPGSRPFSAASRGSSAGGARAASSANGDEVLRPGSPAGGRALGDARWGINEGGRDHLGWVRAMVRYTDTHPVALPAEEHKAEEHKKTVFPSLKPNRREDVALLQHWLEDTMKLVTGTGGSGTGSPSPALESPSTPLELADGALHVYNVAWDELRRQVSSECRERGELMAALWDHYWGLVELRGNLKAERRIAETQAAFGALMAEREKLGNDILALEESLAGADRESRATQQQAARAASSLMQKLVAAQRAAHEIGTNWKVSDLTLQNEVGRRLETDQALSNTKELLNRTEHQWLQFRDLNQTLEGEAVALRDQVVDLQRRLDELTAANVAVHVLHAEALNGKAAIDLQLMSMRHEVETDEILIVGQRQQIRELEAQMAALKAASRDDAGKLSGISSVIEKVQLENEHQAAALKSAAEVRESLESTLKTTEVALKETSEKLRRSEHARAAADAALEVEIARAATREVELETEVDRIMVQYRDSSHQLTALKNKHEDCVTELSALKEHLISLARVLESQGVGALPRTGDKTWKLGGPLGAAQRTASAAQRHTLTLYERLEALKREVGVLNERLKGEVDMFKKIQAELLGARTSEGETMRDKNTLEMKLIQSERLRSVMDGQLLRAQAQMLSDGKFVVQLTQEVSNLREDVARLHPFEHKLSMLQPQMAELTSQHGILQAAYADARTAQGQQARELDSSKYELQQATNSSGSLIEQVKSLNVIMAELEGLRRANKQLLKENDELKVVQDDAIDEHVETVKQLELAKFFLQGLDKDPGGSSGGSGGGSAKAVSFSSKSMVRTNSASHRTGALQGSSSMERPGSTSPTGLRRGTSKSRMRRAGSMKSMGDSTDMDEDGSGDDGQHMESMLLTQNATWLRFKISILAWFSRKLRESLVKETERRVKLELEMLEESVRHMEEMRDREEYFSKELMSSMVSLMTRSLGECRRDVGSLRGTMPAINDDFTRMGINSSVITMGLQWWRAKQDSHVDVACQSGISIASEWFTFIQGLPREPAASALSANATADAIVRIYLRQLATVTDIPVGGGGRMDTTFDAVMAHYNSMRAPGLYSRNFLQDPDSPVARLFTSCRHQISNTKVATFGHFVGLTLDNVQWPMASWHFFLYVLYALRVLLGGAWKSTVRLWATATGVQVPVQAVFDVVGNLFNVQTPTDLDGTVSKRLATLVLPGQAGPCVDLDALLLLLMTEFQAGNCPRSALLFPRRLTDGSLFNIFNVAGYSPQIAAIMAPSQRARKTTEGPGAPKSAAAAKLLARAQAVVAAGSSGVPPGGPPSPSGAGQTPAPSFPATGGNGNSRPTTPSRLSISINGAAPEGAGGPDSHRGGSNATPNSSTSPLRRAWASPPGSRPGTAPDWPEGGTPSSIPSSPNVFGARQSTPPGRWAPPAGI